MTATNHVKRPSFKLIFFLVFYTVMKCLLEAHDSKRARFDRECLAHLTNRMKMWEVAARVQTDETTAEYALTKL